MDAWDEDDDADAAAPAPAAAAPAPPVAAAPMPALMDGVIDDGAAETAPADGDAHAPAAEADPYALDEAYPESEGEDDPFEASLGSFISECEPDHGVEDVPAPLPAACDDGARAAAERAAKLARLQELQHLVRKKP